jgi:hypothetical protein
MTTTASITATLKKIRKEFTYKLVEEEARELSWKLRNIIYVIQKGNTLYTSMSKENGNVLCAYKLGNKITTTK